MDYFVNLTEGRGWGFVGFNANDFGTCAHQDYLHSANTDVKLHWPQLVIVIAGRD